MGGAIFVQQGGRLTLAGPLTINGGTVTGGTGNQNGSAFGSGLFLQGNGITLAFAPAAADAQTISDVVTDQTGSGGTGANAGAGVLALTGAGSLTLTGANTYSGGTTISAGTLFANTAAPDSATGSGAVTVNGGTLAGNGNVAGAVALQGGAIAPGGSAGAVATLSTGALTWSGGAIDLKLGATPSASDAIVVAGALSKAGSGPHVFHFSDGASPPVTCGTTYTLIQASSISGFAESDFSFDYSGSATGFAGRMAIAGNNVVLMGLCTQSIAFPAIPAQTYVSGGTFGVAATASSNLTVTFTSLTPSVCTVSGSTVTMLGTGTCTIAADQAGDATYAAASQMTQDVTINPGTQAVLNASASPSSVAYGGTSTLSTTGGSGTGAVTYAVTTGAAYCSVSSNTLTGTGAGACTVTATKAGDGNYNAASATVDVNVTRAALTVTADNQTRAYGAANPAFTWTPSGFVNGDGAAVLSGAPALGSTDTPTSPVGTTYPITIAQGTLAAANYTFNFVAGTLTISGTANQAALSASASPSSVAYGGTSTLSTTGGSGTGAVTYEVTTGAAHCSVSGNVLTAIGIGTCTATATKAGDTNYAPASATVDVTVGPKTTTITLAAAPNPATANTPVTLTATLAGDPPTGTVTFCDGAATPDAVCTGGTLLCTAPLTPGSTSSTAACAHAFPTTGTHLLGAYYAGNGNYTAIATAQSLVLAVNAAAPPHAVPALSTWLLGLLGGLLAALGLARTRGRSPR
jgi:autotransporter-associated beta strand protein